jgi:hypothetical protein
MARPSDAWVMVAALALATACHRRPAAAPPVTAALPVAAAAATAPAPAGERLRTVVRDEPSARPTPSSTPPADDDMPHHPPPPRPARPPQQVPTWTSVAGDNTSSGRLPMWRQRAKNY